MKDYKEKKSGAKYIKNGKVQRINHWRISRKHRGFTKSIART